jgi:hypothetical protein
LRLFEAIFAAMLIHPPPDPSEANLLPSRVKLPAVIGIEKWAIVFLVIGLVVGFVALLWGPIKSRRGRSSPGVISIATVKRVLLFGTAPLVGLSGFLWLMIDNHYVLDRNRKRILLHTGLRFGGKETVVAEAEHVAAVALNVSAIHSDRRRVGWKLTPVILLRDGTAIKLSSWRADMTRRKWPSYQSRIRYWAAALQCAWIEAPDRPFTIRPNRALKEVEAQSSAYGSAAHAATPPATTGTETPSEEPAPPRLRQGSADSINGHGS